MGYTTDFSGVFTVTPPLDAAQVAYLQKFNETRRMKRNEAATAIRPDPLRDAVGLTVGPDGGYFVGAEGFMGQEHDANGVVEYNSSPVGQPGLWCQWRPTDDGTGIEWDGGEKFYAYVEWLEYIVEHFLKPWGRKIDGEVNWYGEDECDRGIIYAKDNRIEAVEDTIMNEGPSWS